MNIRPFQLADTPILMQLFFETVHQINGRDYSPEQVNAWAPETMNREAWEQRMLQRSTFVAKHNDKIVGFCEIEPDGHIGCFYCHAQHQGQGIGSALLNHLELIASQQNLPKLYTEVSITGKPFFEHRGFRMIRVQQVEVRGVMLANYVMEKILR